MSIKISIITPSFNSGNYLERAIKSVLAQDYDNWEHIVIDGASTDNTLEILKQYEHLLWKSEPDGGQVDAMNKGFAKASGDIMVYLNADDYFLPGAFSAVAQAFTPDVKMVVGKVHVYSEKDTTWWLNDPKIDFESMLRHWELNAFCYNPVGYFYRRDVQKLFPINPENNDKHDLEFLLKVSKAFPRKIKKINTTLGVYCDTMNTKTFKEQIRIDYWRPANFKFVDDLISDMPDEFKAKYQRCRNRGYQLQTHWTIKDAIRLGHADKAYANGDIIQLPCNEDEFDKIRLFGENSTLCAPKDSIVVILSAGKIGTQSLAKSLRNIAPGIHAYPIYDLHFFGTYHDINGQIALNDRYAIAHQATGFALRRAWDKEKDRLLWKFITGVREPVSWMISTLFQRNPQMDTLGPETFWEDCAGCWKWITRYFDNTYAKILNIDIFSLPFDKQNGYSILNTENRQVLLYTLENLNSVVAPMMQEYLGIENFKLTRSNEAVNKNYQKSYQKTLAKIERALDKSALDRVYSHRIVRKFYTDQQIDDFYKRWAKRSGAKPFSPRGKSELQPYQSLFIDSLLKHVEISGKRILEIGSDKQLAIGQVLATSGAAMVQCSNMENFANEIPRHGISKLLFVQCDGRDMPFEDNTFDLIIGCALLEHIHNPQELAREIRRVLKPGGHVYMHGEPLWTCSKGHHIFYVGKDNFYKFNEASNPIPDYGHLTMNRHELASHLQRQGICAADVAGILHYVYNSELLNRLPASEICKAFSKYLTLKKVIKVPEHSYPKHIREHIADQGSPAGGDEIAALTILAEKP